MKRKWPPSSEAFEAFLSRLSPGRQEAAVQFEKLQQRLVRFFEQKGCYVPDELFWEVVARAGQQVLSGAVARDVEFDRYCFGVARLVLKEWWRDEKRDRYWLIPTPQFTDQEVECLRECMERLAPHDREVYSRYHQGDGLERRQERKKLAEEEGGMNNLRIKICRIGKKLRKCLTDCLRRGDEENFLEIPQ